MSIQSRFNRLSQTVIAEAQRERDDVIHAMADWILTLSTEERELWHRWLQDNESIDSMTTDEQVLLRTSAQSMPDELLAGLITTHHRLRSLGVPGY